ncbi:DUF2750 domain-containing protein [Myroides sp. LJL116]
MKDSALIEKRYQRFLEKICENQVVYALKSTSGFAYLYSNHYEDSDGDRAVALCFWSKKAYAKACQEKEWEDFELVEIALYSFLKNWCIGMDKDETIAAIDSDPKLYCAETKPMELALSILEELTNQGNLEHFPEYYAIIGDHLDKD